jgi:ethylmalonyl-CoA mutase
MSRGRDRRQPEGPASIAAAKAGATTGEWSQVLRGVFGEYRGPTGVGEQALASGGALSSAFEEARRRVRRRGEARSQAADPGRQAGPRWPPQRCRAVAIRARDLGMEVIYEGIRLTPAQIVRAAVDEDVHVVGLSIPSGSHLSLVPQVVAGLRAEGMDIPVVAGGIIPKADADKLREAGVAAVFPEGLRADGRSR